MSIQKEGVQRILIVDDNEDLCLLFVDVLALHGYEVITAPNGDRAVEILTSGSPVFDAVVTDLQMADGNGLKVRRHAEEAGIPVILVSAYADAYQDHIRKQDIVLNKPFQFSDLLRALEACIGRSS